MSNQIIFRQEDKNDVVRKINQMIKDETYYRRTTIESSTTKTGVEKLLIRAIPTACGIAIEHLKNFGPTDKQFIFRGDKLEIRKNSIAIYKDNKDINLEDVTIVYKIVSD